MIINSPINLELTQLSGQTSQPPWRQMDDCFSDVVLVGGKPVLFNVKQSGDCLDFSFSGDNNNYKKLCNIGKLQSVSLVLF